MGTCTTALPATSNESNDSCGLRGKLIDLVVEEIALFGKVLDGIMQGRRPCARAPPMQGSSENEQLTRQPGAEVAAWSPFDLDDECQWRLAAQTCKATTFGIVQWAKEEEEEEDALACVMDTLHGNAPLGDPCEDLWHNSILQLGKPSFYH